VRAANTDADRQGVRDPRATDGHGDEGGRNQRASD
jgi:hypothetical protein